MIFTYNYFKNTDVEFDNLDFQRDDQLASFCRERLNRITERTLNVLLLGYKIILHINLIPNSETSSWLVCRDAEG